MTFVKRRFFDRETFYIAFKKTKAYIEQVGEWYDPIELAAYEANLENSLKRLIESIRDKSYKLASIQPIPYPKKGELGQQNLRQFFRIALEDQIVWTAVIMALGPDTDERMPPWSYGNRIYRPVWYESIRGKQSIHFGSAWTSTTDLYRRWNQSWPLFRRHIAMTVKLMGAGGKINKKTFSNPVENRTFLQEKENKFKSYYLNPEFWKGKKVSKIYWASLDFKRFYPSLNPKSITTNLETVFFDHILDVVDADAVEVIDLVKKMFDYPMDNTGWQVGELKKPNFELTNTKVFTGIPTGLNVGGYLANLAMLSVDIELDKYIRNQNAVALFKYVDDHVVLSKSKEDLVTFLNFYHNTLKKSNTGARFSKDKISPLGAFAYDENNGFKLTSSGEGQIEVDVEYPKPLMTQTLQKMSEISSEDYDLADNETLEKNTADLEHLLLTDFPDDEIRRDTRISFAATKLSQIAHRLTPKFNTIAANLAKVNQLDSDLTKNSPSEDKKRIALLRQIDSQLKKANQSVLTKQERILELLIKATEENPDKVKLWKRCIETCHMAGLDPARVLSAVETVNIHADAKLYIKAFMMSVIAERILLANIHLQSNTTSFWKLNQSIRFLNACFNKRLFAPDSSTKYPFFTLAIEHLDLAMQFVYQQKYPNVDYSERLILKSKQRPTTVGTRNTRFHSNEENIWYLLEAGLSHDAKLTFWKSRLEKIDLKQPIAWSILSIFPGHIPHDSFKRIKSQRRMDDFPAQFDDLTEDGQGLLYEMFKAQKFPHATVRRYPILKSAIAGRRNYMSLNEWVLALLEKTRKNSWVDIRLSEWTFLEIIRQIAVQIQTSKGIPAKQFYKVHPANYQVPKVWLTPESNELTWDDWKKLAEDHPIKLTKPNCFIDDFRYFPVSKLWRSPDAWIKGNQFGIIVGLSVLLTKLIAKSFNWPPATNKLAFIDKLFNSAVSAIENQPISSETRALLNEIFSKKDFGFLTGFRFDLDSHQVVKSLSAYRDRIRQIQVNLELHHITIVNHVPRQLTFIDIDKLNEAKSIL